MELYKSLRAYKIISYNFAHSKNRFWLLYYSLIFISLSPLCRLGGQWMSILQYQSFSLHKWLLIRLKIHYFSITIVNINIIIITNIQTLHELKIFWLLSIKYIGSYSFINCFNFGILPAIVQLNQNEFKVKRLWQILYSSPFLLSCLNRARWCHSHQSCVVSTPYGLCVHR